MDEDLQEALEFQEIEFYGFIRKHLVKRIFSSCFNKSEILDLPFIICFLVFNKLYNYKIC